MSSSLIFGLQDPQDYRSEEVKGGWDYPDYQAGPRSRDEEGDYNHGDYDYADYSPRQVVLQGHIGLFLFFLSKRD